MQTQTDIRRNWTRFTAILYQLLSEFHFLLYSLISVDCIFKTNKTGLRPSLHKFPHNHGLVQMSVFFMYKKSYHRVAILRWPAIQQGELFNVLAERNNLICLVLSPQSSVLVWSETSGGDGRVLSCLYAPTKHSKSQLEQILLQIEQFYTKTVLSIKISISEKMLGRINVIYL